MAPRILAIVQARTSSTRLHGKVLRPILGRPMLVLQLERLKRSMTLTDLVVATSSDPSDDALAEVCAREEVNCFRGDLEDVLDRFIHAARSYSPDLVVRLTGDCPLADPALIDEIVTRFSASDLDYLSNCEPASYPDGLDVEVMRFSALETAWAEAILPSHREHVTPFIRRQPERFRIGNHLSDEVDRSGMRWTVDEEEDFEFVKLVYERLYPINPAFSTLDVLELLALEPALALMNARFKRNEGSRKSLIADDKFLAKKMTDRYKLSEAFLDRALKVIPLGSQTFSKSKTALPFGVSPFFVKHAKGSRMWDIDGNEYIDFVNALACVTLGYCDPDVDAAVCKQMESGVTFSLPHRLEVEVAELLVDMIPCAEKVRFAKNGTDATSGAIRVARAYTGRNRVAVCGYHGWQDWFIGSTVRDLGVPPAVKELTHSFVYNDIGSLHGLLKSYPDEFAAVILEPMNSTYPRDGFLEKVQATTHQHGAVLVFDETITGFRYTAGGAQQEFNVTPDLATFGKGIANGYPLSALVGKAEFMKVVEDIFFSGTFGGETLSLAAGKAVLQKLKREPVLQTLKLRGQKIIDGVNQLVTDLAIAHVVGISGHPSWSFLTFKDVAGFSAIEIKTLFLQEVFKRGIYTLGTHNLSYAHSDKDIDRLLACYREVFDKIARAISEDTLRSLLECEPLEPLFKVR